MVTLILSAEKTDEYHVVISLSGVFEFETDCGLQEDEKDDLIKRNTVAILMPYLRSELSIVTAQPETECIVLPPFNINSLFD